MHPAAKKLDRKQRNRVAAEKSRRKRQDEHRRLRERVAELEAINDLLIKENERLAIRSSPSADALLSQRDVALLKKLTSMTNTTTESTPTNDFATTYPADGKDAVMMAEDFKPAALDGKPLQKALPSSSLLSLRRRFLSVMMAPKMVSRLNHHHQTPITEVRVARLLRGRTKLNRPSTPANAMSEHRLVKEMFSFQATKA